MIAGLEFERVDGLAPTRGHRAVGALDVLLSNEVVASEHHERQRREHEPFRHVSADHLDHTVCAGFGNRLDETPRKVVLGEPFQGAVGLPFGRVHDHDVVAGRAPDFDVVDGFLGVAAILGHLVGTDTFSVFHAKGRDVQQTQATVSDRLSDLVEAVEGGRS